MSEIQQGRLAQLREDAANKLRANPLLSGIEVFTERIGDIESKIEIALGSLKGICIIVLTPKANVSWPDSPGPVFDDVNIVVRVVENVLVNQGDSGTKKPCSYIAEVVGSGPTDEAGASANSGLHLFITSENKTLTCRSIGMVPDPDALIYDVIFKTAL